MHRINRYRKLIRLANYISIMLAFVSVLILWESIGLACVRVEVGSLGSLFIIKKSEDSEEYKNLIRIN